MSDEDQNWRFKGFTGGGAYNQTFSLAKPTAPNLDKATPETEKLLQNKFATDSAQYDTQRNTFTQQNGRVNAASRIIPNPSGTDWNATFGRNGSLSSSPTDAGAVWNRPDSALPGVRSDKFNLTLGGSLRGAAPETDYGTADKRDFYRNRVADMDLTKKDFETYGAGSEYGFTF